MAYGGEGNPLLTHYTHLGGCERGNLSVLTMLCIVDRWSFGGDTGDNGDKSIEIFQIVTVYANEVGSSVSFYMLLIVVKAKEGGLSWESWSRVDSIGILSVVYIKVDR